MKDFYPTLTDVKTPSMGVVRFMHFREKGKPQEEIYNFSLIGTREEFLRWAKHEFGYLKIEVL